MIRRNLPVVVRSSKANVNSDGRQSRQLVAPTDSESGQTKEFHAILQRQTKAQMEQN